MMVADGYNAPVSAGNFVDLVNKGFYDGLTIQRADGFVVQTGDPDGKADGYVDPATGEIRTIPVEVKVRTSSGPIGGWFGGGEGPQWPREATGPERGAGGRGRGGQWDVQH